MADWDTLGQPCWQTVSVLSHHVMSNINRPSTAAELVSMGLVESPELTDQAEQKPINVQAARSALISLRLPKIWITAGSDNTVKSK